MTARPPSGRPLGVHGPRFAAPLAAVDRVQCSSVTADGFTLQAEKRVEASDPYLRAHFPSLPIYPGVFVLETVLQAVALVLEESSGGVPEVVEVRSMRFLAPLLAGDTLDVEASVRRVAGGALEVDAACHRRPDVVAARVRLRLGLL